MREKLDKNAIIKELNALIEALRLEMESKDRIIEELQRQKHDEQPQKHHIPDDVDNVDSVDLNDSDHDDDDEERVTHSHHLSVSQSHLLHFERISRQIEAAELEEAKWSVQSQEMWNGHSVSMHEMKSVFDRFDQNGGGTINAMELRNALSAMGMELTEKETNDLMEDVDALSDGEVDFDDFQIMVGKMRVIDGHKHKMAKVCGLEKWLKWK